MAATLKDAKKIIKKAKKPRTSTIDQTVAEAGKALKRQKKVTKTKSMAATLKDAGVKAPKAARAARKANKAKPKKVAKPAKKNAKKGKK